mgnify:FL=1
MIFFEDVELGDELGSVYRSISHQDVAQFVSVWGQSNKNTRFTSKEIAEGEGLSGAIVPGAMSIALLSKLLTSWSPNVTIRKIDIIFRQTVLHNEPLTLRGLVIDKNSDIDEPTIKCDIFIENVAMVKLIIGTATVSLTRRI